MNLPLSKNLKKTADSNSLHSPKKPIVYLDAEMPEQGTLTEVASGIFWLRMPLPFDLDHINLYLLEDFKEGGYALIDTGLGTETTQRLWDQILAALDKPISKVIVTHMHPDHIGMAGYIVDKYKVPLYMSHSEYFVARALFAGSRGASDWQDDEYLCRCGFSEEYRKQASEHRKTSKGFENSIRPIPLQYQRMQHGDELDIGNNVWQVIVGSGHSPEHVCLYNPERQILISGDHILPIISPNIGVYSTEPEANTLQQYLTTLPQFLDLPQTTLVLPSHKRPFFGLHMRVEQLISHHHNHLSNLLDFCKTGKTTRQCLPVLFKRKLNAHNMFFATAEALSHLNYLYFNKQVTRELDESGHYVYQTAHSTESNHASFTSRPACS